MPATAFDEDTVAQVDAVIEHVNGRHADTVLLLANQLAGEPGRRGGAELVAADPNGVDVDLHCAEGHRRLRLSFAEPAPDAEALQARLLGAIAQARAAAGPGVPITSLERELASVATIATHPARVGSVEAITPAMLAVNLTGLDSFAVEGADTFAYVLVAVDGTALPAGYSMDDYRAQGSDGPVRGAYYTVRRCDGAGTVTLWVVLHGHAEGVAGWMRGARPGDPVVLWGPRRGFEPPPGRSLLLAADETGVAAVATIVESLPRDAHAVALLEVGDPAAAPPMPAHPGLDLRWVIRRGPPGTGDELLDAVAGLRLGDPGRWAVFGAAESRQVTRIRRHLRAERGLRADQVVMTGYWRA